MKNYAGLLRAMKREDEAVQPEIRAETMNAAYELAAHPVSREIESKDLLGVYSDGIKNADFLSAKDCSNIQ